MSSSLKPSGAAAPKKNSVRVTSEEKSAKASSKPPTTENSKPTSPKNAEDEMKEVGEGEEKQGPEVTIEKVDRFANLASTLMADFNRHMMDEVPEETKSQGEAENSKQNSAKDSDSEDNLER